MAYAFTDWEGTCLAHHGIKGQKWGVRRYQNEDGSYTALGREHYGVGDRSASASDSDYRSFRSKQFQSMPDGFSRKELSTIKRIENGEVIDHKELSKIAYAHHEEQWRLGEKYRASKNSSESKELSKQMEKQQLLMDFAYDKLPALSRENNYEKEISKETDPKFIDPSYRHFSSKEEKAKAENKYLTDIWMAGNISPQTVGSENYNKYEREWQHLSDRVNNLSFNGYDDKPQSDRLRSLFDYHDMKYGNTERWTPKYYKSKEYKEHETARKKLMDETGVTKANKEYEAQRPFMSKGKDGALRYNVKLQQKLSDAIYKAQKKYRDRFESSGLKGKEKAMEKAFENLIAKNVLRDMGYELTPENIDKIKYIIWVD